MPTAHFLPPEPGNDEADNCKESHEDDDGGNHDYHDAIINNGGELADPKRVRSQQAQAASLPNGFSLPFPYFPD